MRDELSGIRYLDIPRFLPQGCLVWGQPLGSKRVELCSDGLTRGRGEGCRGQGGREFPLRFGGKSLAHEGRKPLCYVSPLLKPHSVRLNFDRSYLEPVERLSCRAHGEAFWVDLHRCSPSFHTRWASGDWRRAYSSKLSRSQGVCQFCPLLFRQCSQRFREIGEWLVVPGGCHL